MVANSSSRAQQHTYMEMYLHTFWAVHSPLSPQHLTELVSFPNQLVHSPLSPKAFHRTCLHFPISLWTRTSNLHKCAFFQCICTPSGQCIPLSLPNISQNLSSFSNQLVHSPLSPKHSTELVCIFQLACGQEHQIYINVPKLEQHKPQTN